jgi:hypothetical protein
VDFEGLRLRAEAQGLGLRLDQFGHALVADFLRALALVADQERHLMGLGRMMAGDVRIDRLELVDEAVLEQEIECPLDGGRRGITVLFAQAVEQVVGLDWLARARHQLQDFTTQRREPQPTLVGGVLDRRDEAACVVVVLVIVSVGGVRGHIEILVCVSLT